jgi:hypothetical protein
LIPESCCKKAINDSRIEYESKNLENRKQVKVLKRTKGKCTQQGIAVQLSDSNIFNT